VNKAKYDQNPYLAKLLLKTEGFHLVEAAPKDEIWGAGVGMFDKDFEKKMTENPGEDYQGGALRKIRGLLLHKQNQTEVKTG